MADTSNGGSALDNLLRKSADVPDASKSVSESVRGIYEALNEPKPTRSSTVGRGPLFDKVDTPSASPDPVVVVAMSSLVLARAVQLYKKRQTGEQSE